MQLLQQDLGRTVVLEDGGRTVRKTWCDGDPAELNDLAAREFDRMTRFAAALQDVESAACPRALELVPGPRPYVRMERAAGAPLQHHLNSRAWTPGLYRSVGRTLRQAVVRYVRTFDEPYWDFIVRNMFYEPDRGLVTFLDFGVPTIYLPALGDLTRNSPLEISLGGLVASSVFESARPRKLARVREHRQAPVLAGTVLALCLERPDGLDVTAEGVLRVARTTYGIASGYGGPARRAWYRYGGRALARPDRAFERFGRVGART